MLFIGLNKRPSSNLPALSPGGEISEDESTISLIILMFGQVEVGVTGDVQVRFSFQVDVFNRSATFRF